MEDSFAKFSIRNRELNVLKAFKKNNGLSFVELLVVTAIFSGIIIIIFGILTSGRRAWLASEAQIDVNSSIRKAVRLMANELSEAAPGNVTITNINADEDRITFRTPGSFTGGVVNWGDQIQYSLGGINSEQLIRTNLNTGATEFLGNYITILRFSLPRADVVSIVVIAQKQSMSADTLQIQLNSQVALRNR